MRVLCFSVHQDDCVRLALEAVSASGARVRRLAGRYCWSWSTVIRRPQPIRSAVVEQKKGEAVSVQGAQCLGQLLSIRGEHPRSRATWRVWQMGVRVGVRVIVGGAPSSPPPGGFVRRGCSRFALSSHRRTFPCAELLGGVGCDGVNSLIGVDRVSSPGHVGRKACSLP